MNSPQEALVMYRKVDAQNAYAGNHTSAFAKMPLADQLELLFRMVHHLGHGLEEIAAKLPQEKTKQ